MFKKKQTKKTNLSKVKKLTWFPMKRMTPFSALVSMVWEMLSTLDTLSSCS